MKFGVFEKQMAIVALQECGKTPKEIRQMLNKLSINERFISCTQYRYRQLREGRPRSVRTPKLTHAVCKWVRLNPLQKQKRLAREMKVSKRSKSRILLDDLRLGS